jgi:hypothetical protein
MPGRRTRDTGETAVEPFATLYDAQGREYPVYSQQEYTQARFGYGYGEEKPASSDVVEEPAGPEPAGPLA